LLLNEPLTAASPATTMTSKHHLQQQQQQHQQQLLDVVWRVPYGQPLCIIQLLLMTHAAAPRKGMQQA